MGKPLLISQPSLPSALCDRSLQEKLSMLRTQLAAIEASTDPEYMCRVAGLETQRDHRLFVAETFRDYELCVASEEYTREKSFASQQYESKKAELKDCLLHDLHDKKRAYDNYRSTVELGAAGKSPYCVYVLVMVYTHCRS